MKRFSHDKQVDSPQDLSFGEHLQALRQVLVQSLFALIFCCALSVWFAGPLSSSLYNAVQNISPNGSMQISALHPLEGVLVNLRLSIYAALLLMLPAFFYSLSRFLFPGLHKKEKNLFTYGCIALALSLALSLLLTRQLVYPWASLFLIKYNAQNGLVNIWSASSLVTFFVHIAFLITLLLFLFFLGLYFVLNSELSSSLLSRKRKGFILFAFTFAALVTPPDILTQLLVALPMIGLYEVLYCIAFFRNRTLINKSIPPI